MSLKNAHWIVSESARKQNIQAIYNILSKIIQP